MNKRRVHRAKNEQYENSKKVSSSIYLLTLCWYNISVIKIHVSLLSHPSNQESD